MLSESKSEGESDDEIRAQWQSYFQALAGKIGLSDWRIYITPDKEESIPDDVAATCTPTFGKKSAYIWLCDEWGKYDGEMQREFAVHELIHCHFAQPALFINHLLHEKLNDSDFGFHDRTYSYLMEFGIDALAKIIAPYMPLPVVVSK